MYLQLPKTHQQVNYYFKDTFHAYIVRLELMSVTLILYMFTHNH